MPGRLGARVWLLRSHPNFFIAYVGMIVGVLGVGLLSLRASSDAGAPPILDYFYRLAPIHLWGAVYGIVGTAMLVGLYLESFQFARLMIAVASVLLCVRLLLQVEWVIVAFAHHDPDVWSAVSGLPLLFTVLMNGLAMTGEPPQNPLSAKRT